jgi:imidazole glycerol phosphate synthase subunit HisF
MAFKRIIATLLIKNGQLVKSYGYTAWRPAGGLASALRNLDRWLVDEILILDISRRGGVNPEVLKTISMSSVSTPLVYGGGIRAKDDVVNLLEAGCDRIVLETLFLRQPDSVRELADMVGAQALIGCVPLVPGPDHPHLWSSTSNSDVMSDFITLINHCNSQPVSEIMVIDTRNEGFFGQACRSLHAKVIESGLNKGIIWFGGLDHEIAGILLKNPETVAVAFGNINFERELQIPRLRADILSQVHGELRRTRVGREQ